MSENWLQTFSGGQFWPLDPRPEHVRLADIAHALSMQCRYLGHTKRFYSVAEHCVLMTRAVLRDTGDEELALNALLHDAAEAYLGDVPRPLKRDPAWATYRTIEQGVEAAIAAALGVKTLTKAPLVEEYDTRILRDEAEVLMRVDLVPWHLECGEPLGVTVTGMAPEYARAVYLNWAEDLLGEERWTRLCAMGWV